MKMLRYSLIISLVLLIFLPVAAMGTMITSHVGGANPINESPAWVINGNLTGSAVNDAGTPAWNTWDTYNSYVNFNYTMDESTFNDPNGWTYTIRTRVVNSQYVSGQYIGLGFWINGNSNLFYFLLVGLDDDNSSDNGLWVHTGGGPNYTKLKNMDTTSAYHTYQVIYNSGENDRVGAFVDGVKVADVLNSQVPAGGGKFIGWGITGSDPMPEEGNWNYVAFETGQNPVPLPPTALLLGSGLLGLAGLRRFRKS